MVARVVRMQGKLFIELGQELEQQLGRFEGREVDLSVRGASVVVNGADAEFERGAREILQRHASTFEKLSK